MKNSITYSSFSLYPCVSSLFIFSASETRSFAKFPNIFYFGLITEKPVERVRHRAGADPDVPWDVQVVGDADQAQLHQVVQHQVELGRVQCVQLLLTLQKG